MKTKFNLLFVFTLVTILISSCSKVKEYAPTLDNELNNGLNGLKTHHFKPTEINLSSFDTTGIQGFNKNNKQNSLIFLRDSIWPSNAGKTSFYETTDIPAVLEETRRKLYLGAILRGETAIDVDNVNPVIIAAS